MNENRTKGQSLDMAYAKMVADVAVDDKLKERDKQRTYRVAIICATLLAVVAIICGTVIAVRTIVEQQYAMNAQYAQMFNLLKGAEVVTESASAESGGTAIVGDGNTTAGGDVNG